MAEIAHSPVSMPTLLNPDRQFVNSYGDLVNHGRQNLATEDTAIESGTVGAAWGTGGSATGVAEVRSA